MIIDADRASGGNCAQHGAQRVSLGPANNIRYDVGGPLRPVRKINAGQSHVQEETELASELAHAVSSGLLSATLNTTEAVRQAGVVVVIVPVVIDANHEVIRATSFCLVARC